MKRIFCILLLCIVLTGTITIPILGMVGTGSSSNPVASTAATSPILTGRGPTLQQPMVQKPAWQFLDLSFVEARQFFVYDTRTESYWHISDEANTAIYPASTTKLFTTYVALQYLSPDDNIKVGAEVNSVAWDASQVGFQKGDTVSVKVLVQCALLPSACDASYILAAAAGKRILKDSKATAQDAISAFMTECNRRAREMGMENCNLVTPDGYHKKDHKLSLQAFVIIGKFCLQDSVISKIVSSPNTTITYRQANGMIKTKDLKNTNFTVRPDSPYYHSQSVGLKTGSTNEAGYCLLTAYEVEGGHILIGVFGCADKNDRFQFANALFEAYLPFL